MGKILIIDDDEMMGKALCRLAESMGHDASYVVRLKDAVERAASDAFDVIFLDVQMPDGNGLDALPKLTGSPSEPEVIIITASGDPDGAELAIRSGAWDYIEKPPSLKDMMLPLVRALQYREEKLSRATKVALNHGIIGNSPKLKRCLDLLAQAANSDANVLITGETGTGKELFAQAIHDNSARSDKPFVVVDCAGIPETLMESALFGHEKGAFTGADKPKEGLILQADSGTLVLDEIGELPLTNQKTLLRVLQERRFRPVGGKKENESNFRLLASTNRNLDEMVAKGQFRKDLLFRLRALTIELPSLRECREDIKELARYHVARLCDRYGTETKGFSPDFFESLLSYEWPGNTRELFQTLEAALSLAIHEPTLYSKHLPLHMRVYMARASVEKDDRAEDVSPFDGAVPASLPKYKDFREGAEKDYLKNLISLSQRKVREACEISGLSRSRLYELMAKHDISLSHN